VKKYIIIALKFGLGIGLLAWVVWSHWHIESPDGTEVGLAGALERPIHAGPLVVAALLCLGAVLFTFVRWFILVRAQDLPFTLADALRLGMIGYYLNTFLPGSVGGDIIKAAFIARAQSRRTVAVATVLVDRVVGLCGLFWLTALTGGVFWATGALETAVHTATAVVILETILLGAMAVVAGSLIFWLILGWIAEPRAERFAAWLERFPKIGHALAELWRAVWLYRRRGRWILLTLVMSICSHAAFVLTFYFAARTLTPAEQIPSLGAHFLIVPVGMTVRAGFPAPGGVGGGEYAYGKLYELLDFAFAPGVLAMLTYRCVEWLWGLVGYLVYLRMRPSLRIAAEKDPQAQESGVRGQESAIGDQGSEIVGRESATDF
jgi:uncharacterized protein (TIRG00374 family)